MTPIIVLEWRCLAQTERDVNLVCAGMAFVSPFFVFAAAIDPTFDANPNMDSVKRRQAWEACYNMPRVLFDPGTGEVAGYFAVEQWCRDLAIAVLEGEVHADDPLCLELAFYNSP